MELNNLLVSNLEAKGFVFPDKACSDISVGCAGADTCDRKESSSRITIITIPIGEIGEGDLACRHLSR